MRRLTLAICARHAETIIGECLESVRHQTVPPDEVIVALDSLDDPTAAVAQEYGATVIASNATGLYQARNAVLAACTTEYVAFTDADCELVPEWVERVKAILDEHPEVAGGTGRHPAIGKQNLAAWLHHMWYIVETESTGPTSGIIGGNSYFRTDALRAIGGWLDLPGHSAAEDVYIGQALRNAGYRLWLDEGVVAKHHYETSLSRLWRKAVMMGRDIIVMQRRAGWHGKLWWYTLLIPIAATFVASGLLVLPIVPVLSAALIGIPLLGSLAFLSWRFRSVGRAVPRWAARWALIWPYSWGVASGLFIALPRVVRSPYSPVAKSS